MATEFPKSEVKEGTSAIFKCSSDEGNPPPVICWNIGSGNAEVKPGRFNASSTESILSIVVDRNINQENVNYFIEDNKEIGQNRLEMKTILNVNCESFYFFV